MRPTPNYLTVREAADALGYRSLRSIHRYIKSGTLKAKRHSENGVKPRWYVSKRSVAAVLRRRSA